MAKGIEAEFRGLRSELTKLERVYNPSEENLHFECLSRADAELYEGLLELADGGLQKVRQHREYFFKENLYCDGMFWYDLFLMISAAACKIHRDEAQATIPTGIVEALMERLVQISEFTLWPALGGDITKRNYEALGNTLWAFPNEKHRDAAKEAARQMNNDPVQEFVVGTISDAARHSKNVERRNESVAMNNTGDKALNCSDDTYLKSTFYEQLVEHVFVSEILQEVWYHFRQTVEVLRSEVDASGYDVVFECNGVVRHVQLKTSKADAKTKSQKVNVTLAKKPSGCIVWIVRQEDRQTGRMKLSYLFFGGEPGKPLPSLEEFKEAKHTKGNAEGVKKVRPAIRVVPKSRFVANLNAKQLVEHLFGLQYRASGEALQQIEADTVESEADLV